jgi:2-polyprenyl-6-methoxyphenol hydroxylase-like FAD-dependent oxidoreductase
VIGDRLDTDHTMSGSRSYEYVIVGGGIHGTCLANYLLAEGAYSHQDLRLVDPRDQLLASFETKTHQCGMRTLRSTFVHHISTEPFSLEAFAEGASREFRVQVQHPSCHELLRVSPISAAYSSQMRLF